MPKPIKVAVCFDETEVTVGAALRETMDRSLADKNTLDFDAWIHVAIIDDEFGSG